MDCLKGSSRSPTMMKNECNGRGIRISLDGCPDCPYIEFGARACTK
jgi:hypothetical protein